MIPLYTPEGGLAGWLGPDGFVFDLALVPVAFVVAGHAWSFRGGDWLGPVEGASCMDRQGRPVAWSPAGRVAARGSPVHPMRPKRPLPPKRPLRPPSPPRAPAPLAPVGGWSPLGFAAWWAGPEAGPAEPEGGGEPEA